MLVACRVQITTCEQADDETGRYASPDLTAMIDHGRTTDLQFAFATPRTSGSYIERVYGYRAALVKDGIRRKVG